MEEDRSYFWSYEARVLTLRGYGNREGPGDSREIVPSMGVFQSSGSDISDL